MAYVPYNPNSQRKSNGDCVVRALTKVLDSSWDRVFVELMVYGLMLSNMPSDSEVWGELLRDKGFERLTIPNTCPKCYTISKFCQDNPTGTFVLVTDTHVVAVINGDYFDTWDSGEEVPSYYWRTQNEL